MIEALRRGEQAATGDHVRITGPTRRRVKADVGPGPRTWRQQATGRQQLDDSRGVIIRIREAGTQHAIARGRPTHHRGHDRLRSAVHQLDDPAVAGHRRFHGLQRPADRGRLPAPRGTQRGARQCVDRQERGSLAAQDPGGAVVGSSQPFQARAHRRLTEHEPDPRRWCRPPIAARVIAKRQEPGRPGQSEDRGRRPLAEAAQVLSQACLQRTERAPVEPLDESPDGAKGVLEREPRVAFAPLGGGWWSDVAAGDAQPGRAARLGGQAARGQDRVQEGQAQCGEHGCRAKIALDPLQDRAQAHQLARGMQIQQLIDQGRRPDDLGEPTAQHRAHGSRSDIRGDPGQIVGLQRRLAMLRAAALVPADRAPVVPADRHRDLAGIAVLVLDRPHDLVDNDQPGAGRATGSEQVADRNLEARVATRRRGHALEGGVEVADVRWPQDDLREHPRQRARFE